MRLLPLIGFMIAVGASAQPLVPSSVCGLDSVLNEASGLLMIDGLPWIVLDSGNPNAIFQVDPATGAITRTLTITNAVNTDWEDLAVDGAWVYIGDIGNNGGNRTDLRIYRVPLSALQDGGSTEVLADTITFVYPDQTDFTTAYDANNRDCEALVASDDSLFLFSKNWLTSDCYLYALSAIPGAQEALRRDTLGTDGLITGATLDSAHGTIALIGHTLDEAPFVWTLSGYEGHDLFGGNADRHALQAPPMQTEGLCWTSPDSVLICSEAASGQPARLWTLELTFTDAIEAEKPLSGLRAYPDPADDVLYIESPVAVAGGLYDESGHLVSRWRGECGTTSIEVGYLPEGRYTLLTDRPMLPIALVIAH